MARTSSYSKGITVDIGGNTIKLDEALNKINSSAKVTQNALKAVSQALEIDPNDSAAITKKYELLAKSVELAAEKVKLLEAAQETFDKKLASGEIDVDKYTEYIANLQKARNNLALAKKDVEDFTASQDKAAESIDELGDKLDDASESIEEVGETSESSAEQMSGAFASAASAIAAMGLDQLFDDVINAIEQCVTAAVDYESAITGVFKTVDGTDSQLSAITEGIKDMALEIPLAASEIANIAEIAGQLGVATDDILEFTRVIADLAASTNLSAEDAATSIAKFANITGMAISDASNFGSALVDLGNNMATTESDIMNMATRIAAAGTQVGLSAPQILAYSAALSSLGLEAEAGGTAFSTALKKIQIAVETGNDDLKKFAEVAGMSAEAFSDLWNTDVEEAINAFINGLANVDGQSESTIALLDEIGFSGIRVSDAWTRLSGSKDLVVNALEIANTAFEENSALTEEAAKRYETAASKFQVLQNAAEQLKIAIGDDFLAALSPAAEWLTEFVAGAADLVEEEPAISAAIAGIAGALGLFAALSSVAAIIGGIVGAIGLLGGAAIPVAVIAGAAAAIGGLAAACEVVRENTQHVDEEVEKLVKTAQEAETAFNGITDAFDKQMDAIDDQQSYITSLIDQIEKLAAIENKTAAEKQQLLNAVDELNGVLPGLALAYDDVTDSLSKTKEEMLDFADAAFKAAQIDALTEQMKKLAALQLKYAADYEEAADLVIQKLKERKEAERDLNEWLEKNGMTPEEAAAKASSHMLAGYDSDFLQDYNKYIGALNDSISAYEKARDSALSLYGTLSDTNSEVEKTIDQFNGLNDALSDGSQNASSFDDFLKELADSTEKAGDAADKATESYEDLQEQLADAQSEYDDLSDGFETLYDGVVTALENKAKNTLKAIKDANDKAYKLEQQRCKEQIAIYEEEYAARCKALGIEVEKTTGELQSRIDAIEGKTAAEEAAEEAAKWQKTLDDYATGTATAYDDVKSYGGKMSSTLDEYGSQQSKLSEDYAGRIATAEQVKADAIAAAQKAISETTAKYEAELAKLDSASEEYANKQFEMAQKLTELNADLSQAELDDSVLVLEKEQADAEVKLAEEKKAALIKAAEETNSISAKYAEEYQKEYQKIVEQYNKKIETAKGKKTKADEAKETAIVGAIKATTSVAYAKKTNEERLELQEKYNEKIATAEEKAAQTSKDTAADVTEYKKERSVKLSELQTKYTDKSREDAIDAANELGDLEMSRAEDVAAVKKEAVEAIRKEQIAAIEEQIKKAEEAGDVLQGQYDQILESQKTEEEAKLESFEESLKLATERAQTNYDTYTESGMAKIDALNLMLGGKQGELVTLLESYNPQFKTAGENFASMYTEGIGDMSSKVETLLGGSLDAALVNLNAKADEVKALWDKINELDKAKARADAQAASDAKVANRMNYNDVRSELIEKYGQKVGADYAAAVNVGMIDAGATFEEAVKCMGLSASNEAKKAGENYGAGFASGVDGTKNKAAAAGAQMGQSAVGGTKDALEEHSPSKVAEEIGANYAEGFALGIEGAAERVEDAANSLGDAANSAVEGAASPTDDISVSGTEGKLGQLGEAYVGLSGDIDTAAASASGFSDVNTGALDTVVTAVGALSDEYDGLGTAAADSTVAVGQAASAMSNAMETIQAQEGKTAKLNTSIVILSVNMDNLRKTSERAKTTFVEFANVAQGVLENVGKSFETLAETIDGVMTAAVNFGSPENTQQFYQSGVAAGSAFSRGLAAGLSSGRGNVKTNAAALADTVTDTVNDELAIHSPSKVAYEQGVYYAQGLANGIDSMTDAVAKSGENVANALTKSIDDTLTESVKKGMVGDGTGFGPSYIKYDPEIGSDRYYGKQSVINPDTGEREYLNRDENGNVWDNYYDKYLPLVEVNVGGVLTRMTQSEAERFWGILGGGPAVGTSENPAILGTAEKLNDSVDTAAKAIDALYVRVGNSVAPIVRYGDVAPAAAAEASASASTQELKLIPTAGDNTAIPARQLVDKIAAANDNSTRRLSDQAERLILPLRHAQEAMSDSLRTAYDGVMRNFASVINLLPSDQNITVNTGLYVDGQKVANSVGKYMYQSSATKARNKGVAIST